MKGRSLLLIVGAAAVAGCGNPTGITANLDTFSTVLTVFAFSGTPLSAPTGIDTYGGRTVVTDGSSTADVIFDIRNGQAVAIPPLAITGIANAGIQKVSGPFDSLLTAPASGYNDSTAIDIAVGDVLAVQAQPSACSNILGLSPFIYSKMQVTAVNTSDTTVTTPSVMPPRTIQVTLVVDPNCNFRSLAPGVPTS
ncbi:MAG TPA: hypothetical protein VFJ96_13690 [Gemmatimonadaceae bacterium]|jgi:hypothetical protein|nr:hypothetical protein [Gemmatimonadaceae bacterium]